MPAHQTCAAIGVRVLSNGDKLSAIDWRANRLVDALAKQAAALRRAPIAITRLLGSARAAVRHAACLLGRVTHAANNCQLEVLLPDGSHGLRTCRDAQQCTGQRRAPKRQRPLEPPHPLAASCVQKVSVQSERDCGNQKTRKRTASQASLHSERMGKVARAEQARSNAAAEAHVQRLVEETSSRLAVPAGRVPASVRLQKVLDRVRARAAAGGRGAA